MIKILVYASLFLSPFFLWQSGLPQISHLLVALALALRLFIAPMFAWERYYFGGVIFVGYTFVVGAVVFLFHGDHMTLLAPLYYAFGLGVYLLLTTLLRSNQKSLNVLFWIHVTLLAVVFGALVAGFGRQFGANRFMFLFNDPNQMANWVLWAALVIGVSGQALYGRWWPGFLAMLPAGILIVFTASRSGLLGFAGMFCVYLAMLFATTLFRRSKGVRVSKKWVIAFVLSCVFAALVTFVHTYSDDLLFRSSVLEAQMSFLHTRIFTERGPDDSLAGRGYDRLWLFPEYLVFGSGEGANNRFATRSPFTGEIHSSWAGVLFSYGIVGFGFLCIFLWGLLSHVADPWSRWMFVGPFLYGMATYNVRNWYFWVGLAVIQASSKCIQAHSSFRELL